MRRLRAIQVLIAISLAHPIVPVKAFTRALGDPDPVIRLVIVNGMLAARNVRECERSEVDAG